MTTGEKIRCFRTLKNITQKTLGEMTGIDEATIRKYELGTRNPKPAQIKKIAQALEIGENILLDIPLSSLTLETVGDAMALYFLFDETIGIKHILFENEEINKQIEKWLATKKEAIEKLEYLIKHKEEFAPEEFERANVIVTSLLEVEKQKFISDQTPLRKK